MIICDKDFSDVDVEHPKILTPARLLDFRFHDLHHLAATNMHELTMDFYTVGEILGHTLKGIGMSPGISTNMADMTARYVDVRLDRKATVLEAYHNALFPKEAERIAQKKLASKERDKAR